MAHRKYSTTLFQALVLAACGFTLSAYSSGGGFDTFNPSAPGPKFLPATTAVEQNALIQEMWNVLTAAICWDASFVTDPTLAGSVGGVSQFQFHSNYQFRHVGFSISFGTILLHDIGTYDGYRTAIVETWTGDIEAILIYDDRTIVHVLKNPSGVPFYVAYGVVDGGGACL